jgi:hypothetical protein
MRFLGFAKTREGEIVKFFQAWVAWVIFGVGVLAPAPAQALPFGQFEISFGFGYSIQRFGDNSYNWNRRIGASIGYYPWALTEIELAFQDVVDRTKIEGFQDTTFHDQIYSVNVVQQLVPKEWPVQPYVKLGVGQLNRTATGTYSFGSAPPTILDSITVITGAGLRVYITKIFAIRGEATSFIQGGILDTWDKNLQFNAGVSVVF